MKRNLIFFLYGIGVGALIFWLPAIISGTLFFAPIANIFPRFTSSWLLPALPYVFFFFLLGIVWAVLARNDFRKRLENVFWFCLGLYLSLSFFLWFLVINIHIQL